MPDARQIIDRAKAAVMARQAMTEQQAFRWLQRAAIDHRTSIRAVADRVIRHQAPVACHHAAVDRTRSGMNQPDTEHDPMRDVPSRG